MRRFAETCKAVSATPKKSEKVRRVADYLGSLPPEDAARAAVFLTGRPFPRSEETVSAVGGSLLWQAILQIAGAEPEQMQGVYRKYGDLGDLAGELLGEKSQGEGISLAEGAAAFAGLAALRGPTQKLPALVRLLRRARATETTYIVKILTGELRIGLKESLVEEAIALAFGKSLGEVERANMLTGDIGRTLLLAAQDRLGEAQLRPFHPIGCMLASPADNAAEAMEYFPAGALVEDKHDGIRVQAHKFGSRVKLFSRTLDEVTEFPELVAPLARLSGDLILDGEVLAWRDARPLPFRELQKRLGRKAPDLWLQEEIPVAFLVFDLLFHNGELLLDIPLGERHERLVALLGTAETPLLQLAPARRVVSAVELEAAFEAALTRGNEGAVAKAPDSLYTPGRRGRAWLKLKRPLATLDVVVTAVEYGHGKRRGLLSDYTFSVRDGDQLRTIGKAYSGLTDEEIRRLTEYFEAHTLEDRGLRRRVEPTVVLEVAFNNIQRSARHQSGYALRFPRILRLRPDKSPEDIDTLERVRELYERQSSVKPKPG